MGPGFCINLGPNIFTLQMGKFRGYFSIQVHFLAYSWRLFSQGDMGLMGLQTILVALHQLGQLLLDSEVTKGVFFCPINEGSWCIHSVFQLKDRGGHHHYYGTNVPKVTNLELTEVPQRCDSWRSCGSSPVSQLPVGPRTTKRDQSHPTWGKQPTSFPGRESS